MKIKKIILMLPMLLFVCFGCKNDEVDYPVEIMFIDCSLDKTNCSVKHFENDKVFIINSIGDLKNNYISCSDDSYPVIDFSKHTLLLAKGTATNGIKSIVKKLRQVSKNKYVLDVEVTLNDTCEVGVWQVAIITSKLNKKSNIELNVNY